jgi:hypothetical protein
MNKVFGITIILATSSATTGGSAQEALPLPLPIPSASQAVDVFEFIGKYRIRSRLKITDDKVTRVTIKPMVLSVTSNGLTVRVSSQGNEEAVSKFDIYRSDGIGRQHDRSGVLEVIPGIQGSSSRDGVLRHIRITREGLTITQFAGVSNQTVITHATAVQPDSQADPG